LKQQLSYYCVFKLQHHRCGNTSTRNF